MRQEAERKPWELCPFAELDLHEKANWARRELLRSDLPDARLRERMVQNWERHPGGTLPAIFHDEAELRAVVCFLHNGRVEERDILQPNREALLERMQVERTKLHCLVGAGHNDAQLHEPRGMRAGGRSGGSDRPCV